MTEKVKAWPPPRYSGPLREDFTTDGDKLLALIDLAYRLPDGSPIILDQWQRDLVRAVLETYPPGHPKAGQLRYRQVFISVGRQNGKSVLGAIFAIYGLMRQAGALVIGLASSADQANICYSRVLTALKSHPSMAKRFNKTTETRGIRSTDGSRYMVKASKSAAVQGLDISLGLGDELHIMPPELWSDMVSGLGGRPNGIVIGITTAGDDNSALLKDLYLKADDGSAGEQFGYFIWEAPDDRLPEDDEEFGRYICLANPAVAEGRLDLATVISDVRSLPPADQLRYRMNRFVAAVSVFLPLYKWQELEGDIPHFDRPVFAFDMTPEKEWCTITASQLIDGVTYTKVIASIPNATQAQLVRICEQLWEHSPAKFVVNGNVLGGLGAELDRRRYPVAFARSGDEMQSSAHLYSLVSTGRLRHAGDPLLNVQIPAAVRKNVGDRFKISKKDSSTNIDALYATAFGCYYAELEAEQPSMMFF